MAIQISSFHQEFLFFILLLRAVRRFRFSFIHYTMLDFRRFLRYAATMPRALIRRHLFRCGLRRRVSMFSMMARMPPGARNASLEDFILKSVL